MTHDVIVGAMMGRSELPGGLSLVIAAIALLAAVGCGSGSRASAGEDDADARDGSAETDPRGDGSSSTDGGEPDAPGAPCRSDRDCRDSAQLCDVAGGVCVDCLRRADCGSSETCAGGRCVALAACDNSLDCAGEALPICDPLRKVCVECAQDADCEESHDCSNGRCIAFTRCTNSLDCPQDQVCDVAAERCFDCAGDADCEADERCVGGTCRLGCQSDRVCTPFGLLCHPAEEYCAECLSHRDCAATEHCELGLCRPDVCAPDEAYCEGNSRVACDEAGSGFLPPAPCPTRHACAGGAGEAQCHPWVCTAGVSECHGNEAVECAADGLSERSRIDCGLDDKNCVRGECSDLLCPPGELYCDPEENVRRCGEDGLSEGTLETPCEENQYCDESGDAPRCRRRICEPGAAVCNATCNGRGSGFVGGQQPCPDGRYCSGGTCMTAADDWGGVREASAVPCTASTEEEACGELCGVRDARCSGLNNCFCIPTDGVRPCHPLEPWRTDGDFLACPLGHTCVEQSELTALTTDVVCRPAAHNDGTPGSDEGEQCGGLAASLTLIQTEPCDVGLWCKDDGPDLYGIGRIGRCAHPCDGDWRDGDSAREAFCGDD